MIKGKQEALYIPTARTPFASKPNSVGVRIFTDETIEFTRSENDEVWEIQYFDENGEIMIETCNKPELYQENNKGNACCKKQAEDETTIIW
ncbi:hypothetical protein L1D34_29715 [Vibrio mediterranei]|uniref:hypothetical protein n=1 Tax=Vibrio mediterranei TaxID=689 RepID=UPI001EFEAE54|nr:hypothetical protein [Vibrio mediterranei]MCG9628985.1 hypothetical protein [Vibrio mediterranei]